MKEFKSSLSIEKRFVAQNNLSY